MKGDKLNPKQRRFVAEYLKDQNGTQAAIRAGYSKKTANEQASQLLAKLNIKGLIDEHLRKIEKDSVLTAENVRADVARLLGFDPRKAFNADGTMKKIYELDETTARAVVGIDADDKRGELARIRFTDRIRLLELAAKILGMLKFQITGKDDRPLVPHIDFSRITDDELRNIARHGQLGVI